MMEQTSATHQDRTGYRAEALFSMPDVSLMQSGLRIGIGMGDGRALIWHQ